MKFVLLILCVVALIGCGNPALPGAPSASNDLVNSQPVPSSPPPTPAPNTNPTPGPSPTPPPSPAPPPPAPTSTYDMLQWMTMDPSLSATYHMSGTANPIYTSVLPDRYYWTKTGQGFPWDIQLYDNNYIYLWVTELDWHNPNTFKIFNSPTLGYFNMPLAPRFAQGGYPGSTIKVSDSTYEIHTDCSTFTTKTLSHVINEVWGPYTESLGGQLPADLQTLVISYRYACDLTYSNCKDKEEFHVAKPYGLVKWQHQKLQADGNYAPPDNVSLFNRLVSGQTQVVTTCF